MKSEATTSNNNGTEIKESWTKPQLSLLAIKGETLGNHSLHGTDFSFSS